MEFHVKALERFCILTIEMSTLAASKSYLYYF